MPVDIGRGGTEGSHYTYLDQDRRVRLDQCEEESLWIKPVSVNVGSTKQKDAAPMLALSSVFNHRSGRKDSTSSPKTSVFRCTTHGLVPMIV